MRLMALFALASAEVYFEEDFSGDWQKKWVEGKAPGKEMGKWFVDEEVNKGMQATEDMRFYSISAKMDKPSTSKGKPLVLQFSAKVENHQYAFCGGGYIKLIPDGLKQETFGGDDEYHIMFGPDLCGYDVSHIHAIFNHKGTNLLKTDKISLEYSDKNEFTHLYTLHIKPDGYDDIPAQIPDPDATKPEDWDDEDDGEWE